MKIACTMTALLALLSVPTMAQEESKFHFIVNGGLSEPDAPAEFKAGWKDGSNIGGGIGYRFSPHLSVQGLLNYDRFSVDSEGLLSELDLGPLPDFVDLEVTGAETSVLSLSGELKASLVGDPNRVSPYVTICAGVADVKVGDITISTSFLGLEIEIEIEETMQGVSETVGMAAVGAGLDIPFGERLGAFVEGRYQSNFTEGDSMDFSSFHAGIRINR